MGVQSTMQPWARTPRTLTPQIEGEKAYATAELFADISVVTADQSLGSQTITVAVPTNATIIGAIALCVLDIMNDAAVAQKIDLDMEVGGVSVFSQDDVIGFPALDGASGVFSIFVDVSAIVTAAGAYVLEAFCTLSDAHSTHFTVNYGLIIIYRMS